MANYLRLMVVAALVLTMVGCDMEERTGRLEKQVEELKAEVSKIKASSDFDMQAKCSRDAEAWFDKGWSSDKNTILLDHRNHYNKSLNKCFVEVENHYHDAQGDASWINDMSLWNLYENLRVGRFAENHEISWKPRFEKTDTILSCEFEGQKCDSVEKFNAMVDPYLNN